MSAERAGLSEKVDTRDRGLQALISRIRENLLIDGLKPSQGRIRGFLNKYHAMELTEGKLPEETQVSDIDLDPWEREVEGMYRAINLVDQKATGNIDHGFDGNDVLALHKAVLNDPFNPHFSGALRKALVRISVRVRGEVREASFTPVDPKELPGLFGDFSQELLQKTSGLNEESPVSEVLDIAAWAHQRLIELHPFIDGNGRTARLLVDLIFKRRGLPHITDWGARNDEYKDVVDKSFRRNDGKLFKKLLAKKLLKSVKELEREGLIEELLELDQELSDYLDSL